MAKNASVINDANFSSLYCWAMRASSFIIYLGNPLIIAGSLIKIN